MGPLVKIKENKLGPFQLKPIKLITEKGKFN
jgi:hypothetical protein